MILRIIFSIDSSEAAFRGEICRNLRLICCCVRGFGGCGSLEGGNSMCAEIFDVMMLMFMVTYDRSDDVPSIVGQ